MIKIGYQPTSIEYSKIIKTAAKTRNQDIVEQIWKYIRSSNVEISTDLWNSYIRATCNADETLWYRRFNRNTNCESKKIQKEPIATNHAVNLVTQMIEEGVTPNSRTFELVILYLGQAGELDYVKSLIHSLWGVSLNCSREEADVVKLHTGDLNYPTITTLSSIINSFGVSNQFLIGLQIMERIQKQYNIVLDGSSASLQLWKSMMRWAFWTSEPWGNTSPFALELVWKTIIETNKIQPSGSMIHYKILRELCRRDYDSAASMIPMFFESSNVKYPDQHVVQSLKKVARGYIRIGNDDKCVSLLKKYESFPGIYQEVFDDIQRYNKPSVYGKFSSDILALEHFEAAADELYNVEDSDLL
ncbi:uncharacterized protein SAPINGB_P001762 [Magnusiomyces paraingens]|uniref:ATPase expression protein 2, mitochondrial n=1 Tax=Magnusiomyces paraingens TaxID=2606893 RepID=A0A5E8BCI5_9ASCO|nr:uncharacterized protein SAPINGB_P001762 [Saprochaete ingens]VVT48404.1 unnamed protein product [Saprochaete ingens]